MDTTSGFYAQDSGDWEVFKEAFEPPPGPRSKPWERAPIPAHAPRLHGQKIWKRAGLRAQNNTNKENIDAAQLELEREGAGARKKARVLGTNTLLDATWREIEVQDNHSGDGMKGAVSPGKRDQMSMVGGSEDALVVPRKRTNANHLITPRRPKRRVPLKDLESGLGLTQITTEHGAIEATQIACASQQRMALNDTVELVGASNASPEKPVRRRKSLRKSARGFISTAPEEQSTIQSPPVHAAIEKEIGTAAAAPSQAQYNLPMQDSISNPFAQELALNDTETAIGGNASGSHGDISSVTSVEEVPSTETPHELEKLGVGTSELEIAVCGDDIQTIQVAQAEQLAETDATNLGYSTLEEHTEPEALQEQHATDSSLGLIMKEGQTESLDQANTDAGQLTMGAMPTILEAVVLKVQDSPTKAIGTPRRGKKASTPQVSRRSTRAIRTSSILTETNSTAGGDNLGAISGQAEASSVPTTDTRPREIVEIPKSIISLTAQEKVSIQEAKATSTEVELCTTNQESTLDNETDIEVVQSDESLDSGEETPKTPIFPPSPETNDSKSLEEPPSDEITDITSTMETTLDKSKDGETNESNRDGVDSDSSLSEFGSGEETVTQELHISADCSDMCLAMSFSMDKAKTSYGKCQETTGRNVKSDESDAEDPEDFEPISLSTASDNTLDNIIFEIENLAESTTPDPSTSALVEAISENAPAAKYDEDDTDLLRNFLTRVKANKEAKAKSTTTKRKRSFPHSPMKLPLGSIEPALSPSPPASKDDFDNAPPTASPTKRRKKNDASVAHDVMEPQSIRRSGRTRLPVKTATVPAPSFIPVRRLGQEGDNTITLRRSEEKELAALTKINTRKNKGNAASAPDVLTKLAQEKEDPASRHQALKQKFEEKAQNQKGNKRKSVVWAEVIAQYSDGKKPEPDASTEVEKDKSIVEERKSSLPVKAAEEKKTTSVKVGVRSSRISMGMGMNGTPAPKRKGRGVRS